ncbi:protein RALF-like 22 [Cornus florida]|uniref:protein RALF-like 22 n=1 Tax=Cornus florida TaxID=4283 RepID=UPI00289D2EF0|nr:protein RALF-like 22 [Cornus florida]
MANRLGLVLLLVALAAAAAESKLFGENVMNLAHLSRGRGLVADFVNPREEMMMASESARRTLEEETRSKFISYEALLADNIPCDKRGSSYYNCQDHGEVNPYNRGCNFISKCARHTD